MKVNTENIDLILWKKLKKGDIIAFGELYDLYIDALFSHGLHLTNDKEYVMDCIHDLFLDLYKYRLKLTKTDNVKNYLLKSLSRKINRKYKRKTVVTNTETLIDLTAQVGYSRSCEEELIEEENAFERIFILRKAVNFLSKRQQKGLFLRFTEDRPYEEIAEIMNVSVPTSRTIVYRGIKALRHHLAVLF